MRPAGGLRLSDNGADGSCPHCPKVREICARRPRAYDRFGVSSTCPRPHHPLELRPELRASGARRGPEKLTLRPLSHMPVLPITRGLPEHPALAVKIAPEVRHCSTFTIPAPRSFSPNGTNSPGLAPICAAAGCPRRFPYLRHVSPRIVRDCQRAFWRSPVPK